MMNKNSDICFKAPQVPKAIRSYLVCVVDESPRGIDWSFGSIYMQEKLDQYPWDTHNIQKPDLATFWVWAMRIRKKGRNKENRKPSIKFPTCDDNTKQVIITKVKSIVSKINDSFIGSSKFYEIQKEIELKYGVPIWMFAGILIAKRKRTPSTKSGNVYAYYVAPVVNPDVIKLGYTEKNDPYERMNEATQNIASENPKMIGWFPGSKKDEKELLKHFQMYRVKGCRSKEVFKFGEDLHTALDYIRDKIEKSKGIIENHSNN